MLWKVLGNNTKLYVNDTKSIHIYHWKIQGEGHMNGILVTIWGIENNKKPTTD